MSKVSSKNFLNVLFSYLSTNEVALIIPLFIATFAFRVMSILPSNIVFDYDQQEDLFYTKKLLSADLIVIGRPTATPVIHQGVMFFYYLFLPLFVFRGNPVMIAVWNSFFQSVFVVIMYFLGKHIFNNRVAGILTGLIMGFSSQAILISGWISNPTLSLIIVPFFYLGLWFYYTGKKFGLPLAFLSLGLAIQSDIMFLYLIFVMGLFVIIFRPRIPELKLFFVSAFLFVFSVSTFIVTELKSGFAGFWALMNFSKNYDDAAVPFAERFLLFTKEFIRTVSANIVPEPSNVGIFIFLILILTGVYFFRKNFLSRDKKLFAFLVFYLFSPAIMLFWGFHNQPWFLIAVPPAAALMIGFIVSKFSKNYVLFLAAIIIVSNIFAAVINYKNKTYYVDAEESSRLSSQLEVIDYTYKNSEIKPFDINTVTYPLYVNGPWAYHYEWYGLGKYGYKPGWLGGAQVSPYNSLPMGGNSDIFFMIINETDRIPEGYKIEGRKWAEERGRIVEDKKIGGFTVLKVEKNE